MTNRRDVNPEPERLSNSALKGRNVIAVIGIDRYLHWRSLGNAVSDALGARSLFQQLGFEEITDPLLDEKATGDAIEALVTDELTSLHDDDSLILFYAGHGGTRSQTIGDREISTGYLIPVDGANASHKVATWVELDSWLRRVSKLPPRHILVILDACHSGIALSPVIRWGRDGGTSPSLPFAALQTRYSRLVITSALDNELALDNGPVPGHSLFTGCLIEGLTGGLRGEATWNGRQVTTGSDIGRYLRRRVQTYPGSPGWRQTPDFGCFDFDDRGEMLIPLLSPKPTTEILPSRAAQPTLKPASSITSETPVANQGRRWIGLALVFAMASTVILAALSANDNSPPRMNNLSMDASHLDTLPLDASRDAPVDATASISSLVVEIDKLNPLVKIDSINIQTHQTTQIEYALYRERLKGDALQATTPRFDWTDKPGHIPVTSTTFDQAMSYCIAIGGRLPTEQEWEDIAKGSWGLDPSGSGQRGPLREWTSTLVNEAVRVCGATQQMTDGERARVLRMPLYKSRIPSKGATKEKDPVSSPEIGFRCVR